MGVVVKAGTPAGMVALQLLHEQGAPNMPNILCTGEEWN